MNDFPFDDRFRLLWLLGMVAVAASAFPRCLYAADGSSAGGSPAIYPTHSGSSGDDRPATPVILDQSEDHALVVGDDLTLFVSAVSKPEPAYQWFFNGNVMSGETGNALLIDAVTAETAGTYSVVAMNGNLPNAESKPIVVTIANGTPGADTVGVRQLSTKADSAERGTDEDGMAMIGAARLVPGDGWLIRPEATDSDGDGVSSNPAPRLEPSRNQGNAKASRRVVTFVFGFEPAGASVGGFGLGTGMLVFDLIDRKGGNFAEDVITYLRNVAKTAGPSPTAFLLPHDAARRLSPKQASSPHPAS